MRINLEQIAKLYRKDWIFKKVDYTFESNRSYVILGGNGSGKSTLLKIISGSLSPSKGKITYTQSNHQNISSGDIYQHIGMVTPYMALPEQLSIAEIFEFYKSFTPMRLNDASAFFDFCYLNEAKDKKVKELSSGMLQRFKLALVFASEKSIWLFDEPSSNLDAKAIQWYQESLNTFKKDKLVIICSNEQTQEYPGNHYTFIDTKDYK